MRFATPRPVDCLVFLLLFSGPPRLRVRDATASLRGETDAAILIHLLIWTCGLVWLFVRLYPVLVERGLFPRIAAPQALGGMLLVVLSLGIWLSPGRLLTGYTIYQMGVMLAFGWVFIRLYGPDVYVRYLFWGYLLLAIAILLAWIFIPALVVQRSRLRGDLIGPTGAIAALGLMLCLSGAVRLNKGVFLLAAGVFSIALFAAQNRTSYAAFALFLALGWMFRHSAPIKKVIPIAVVALLLAGLFDTLSQGQQYVTREGEAVETMSDRIPLWEHLVGTMLRESPALGLGYYSASRVVGPQYNPKLGNAHSAFVEVLVGGGLAGGFLFFGLYTVLFVYAAKLFAHGRDDPLALAVLGLFSIAFFMSLTNTEGILSGPLGFTFWSTTALLPVVWEQIRSREATNQVIRHANFART